MQKAPAATIDTLGKSNNEEEKVRNVGVDIIGSRHGEKAV